MARKRSHRDIARSYSPYGGGTYVPTLKQRLWAATPISVRKAVYKSQEKDRLRKFEDRRTFHPSGPQRPARSFNKSFHTLRIKGIPIIRHGRPGGTQWNAARATYEPLPYRIGFVRPERVLMCVRRKIRREVLHATGIAGVQNVARLFKPRKYNEYSSVSC